MKKPAPTTVATEAPAPAQTPGNNDLKSGQEGSITEKVRFDESPAPALSSDEDKTIKNFSKAFDLNEERMKKILENNKTPEGLSDDDKKYLREQAEKNKKFKDSSVFKNLVPEDDKNKVEKGPEKGPDGPEKGPAGPEGRGDEESKRKRLNSGGQEKGGGEENKGDNKKLMFALGLLFIACLFLATGGAALPLIGAAIGLSQGVFIAGAVGAGLVGAGLFIRDQFNQGNNNQGGVAMGQGGGGAVANESGQAQAPENAQGKGQGQAPEKTQGQATAPEKAQGQGQAPAPEKTQGQGQAPAPEKTQGQGQAQAPEKVIAFDLMQMMIEDLKAQQEKDKDALKGFQRELNDNTKLQDILNKVNSSSSDEDLKTYSPHVNIDKKDQKHLKALPNDIKEKLSQADKVPSKEESLKIGKSKTYEDFLETKKPSWAEKVEKARSDTSKEGGAGVSKG